MTSPSSSSVENVQSNEVRAEVEVRIFANGEIIVFVCGIYALWHIPGGKVPRDAVRVFVKRKLRKLWAEKAPNLTLVIRFDSGPQQIFIDLAKDSKGDAQVALAQGSLFINKQGRIGIL